MELKKFLASSEEQLMKANHQIQIIEHIKDTLDELSTKVDVAEENKGSQDNISEQSRRLLE